MTTDADLIKLISDLSEPASRAFRTEHLGHLGDDAPRIWDIAKPLNQAMDAHPEFAEPFSKYFLGKQIGFFNNHQAINLLRVAASQGADEALDWYRRVIRTERTGLRIVAEVYGLWVQQAHTFSNGVTLLPVSDLPDSPNSSLLKQPMPLGRDMVFPAAVTISTESAADDDHEAGHARYLQIAEKMRKTITSFALSDVASPIMATAWSEFIDADLANAEFGRMWMSSRHEGRHPRHPEKVTDEMLGLVETYLGLPKEVAEACDVPLARLNLARRRLSPGDKAIDGSICLEALLSGRSGEALTHKLAVRAALLLGATLEEREAISRNVRKFYQLRSQFVHGAANVNETHAHEIAEAGLAIAAAAIRAVVNSATKPEPEIWELTGGPVWNRLQSETVRSPVEISDQSSDPVVDAAK